MLLHLKYTNYISFIIPLTGSFFKRFYYVNMDFNHINIDMLYTTHVKNVKQINTQTLSFSNFIIDIMVIIILRCDIAQSKYITIIHNIIHVYTALKYILMLL